MKIIKLTLLLIFAISLNKAAAQLCEFNPNLSSEIVPIEVYSTTYAQAHYTGAVMFYQSPSSRGLELYDMLYGSPYGWVKRWTADKYSDITLAKLKGRIVSGDFDNDGKEDDIAALYYGGNNRTSLIYWIKDNNNSYTAITVWQTTVYDASQANYKIVSGDFDKDGKVDDIAAFYDFGTNHTRIHVWTTNGYPNFDVSSSKWWEATSYNANKVEGRVVAGDFDQDGYKNDLAAMYDYGNNCSRIHVWKGSTSSFNCQSSSGYWSSTSGYDASKVKFRFISGNFDRQTNWLGNLKPYCNDIAAMYDYGNGQTRIHVWTLSSDKNSFNCNTWSVRFGYDANKVNHRMVPATIVSNNNSNCGYADIAAFYDYGSQTDKLDYFVSHSTYGDATYFSYGHLDLCRDLISSAKGENLALNINPNKELVQKTELTIYPNPVSSRMVNVQLKNINSSDGIVEVYTVTGMIIYRNKDINKNTFTIDVSKMASGVYYLKYSDKETILTKKIIIN